MTVISRSWGLHPHSCHWARSPLSSAPCFVLFLGAMFGECWSPAWPKLCLCLAVDLADPDLRIDFSAWPQTCLITAALPEDQDCWLDLAINSGLPYSFAGGCGMDPGCWGSCRAGQGHPCGSWPPGRHWLMLCTYRSVGFKKRKCLYSSILCQGLKRGSGNSFHVQNVCTGWPYLFYTSPRMRAMNIAVVYQVEPRRCQRPNKTCSHGVRSPIW